MSAFCPEGCSGNDACVVGYPCERSPKIESNMRIYQEEIEKAFQIRQVNRHRSVEPYDWFGPEPEPCPPGKNCGCPGCEARSSKWNSQ